MNEYYIKEIKDHEGSYYIKKYNNILGTLIVDKDSNEMDTNLYICFDENKLSKEEKKSKKEKKNEIEEPKEKSSILSKNLFDRVDNMKRKNDEIDDDMILSSEFMKKKDP